MKRTLTLCLALTVMTFSAMAETLKVGDKDITSSQSSIKPKGLTNGTIKWDASSKTLTFTNVVMNCDLTNAVTYDGARINMVFEGKNVIKTNFYDFEIKVSEYCTINGSNAYLELESNPSNKSARYNCIWMSGSGDLMIRNIYLKATANTDAVISSSGGNPLAFQSVWAQLKTNASGKKAVENFTNCIVSSGSYVETGAWSETSKTFVSGSTALAQVSILPYLTVGGTIVDTDQYEYGFDPKGKTGGSIYFEDDGSGKPTLTFNAVKGQMGSTDLPSPYGTSLVYNKNIENLTILFANANTLSAVSGASETWGIYSAKPLLVKGSNSSASLTYTGDYGLYCDDDLEIKDLTMNMTGEYPIQGNSVNMIINNCTITATTTATYDNADAIQGYCTLTGCAVSDGYLKNGRFYGYDGKVLSTVKIVPLADYKIDINTTNFPDDNFRAIVKGTAINKNNDDNLSWEEVMAVKSLNVASKGIKDLKGIEFFTALTVLYCNINGLKSLDVSNNTALTELYCNGNGLKSLDVSKNTALTILNCCDNSLESLDVSKNTALTKLHCYYNSLQSLDVSKNTALEDLACHYNKLKSLNVSKNSSLNGLSCYGNQIEGSSMDNLVNSLPNTHGTITVCVDGVIPDNVITKAQVKVATDNGWTVVKYTNDENNQRVYVDYAGLGDVNGDNKISQADLDLLVKIVMGQQPAYVAVLSGDLNNDGKTDAQDVVILVNILNGK